MYSGENSGRCSGSISECLQKLEKEVDEVAVVLIPDELYGAGAFYEDFEQVSDVEVMLYPDKLKKLKKAG